MTEVDSFEMLEANRGKGPCKLSTVDPEKD